ncbi:hypothetical protein KSZ_05780 [Dictyobacter formicarum]|uniref:Uncharacterized protein n=1 Tax=Dictyobacter formicarum TaxID=2778368 RepID=A0ABQ3V8W6_9CHLR|nr:hypothetical protein KSZ_05780 [Dictyobacter formicarum]
MRNLSQQRQHEQMDEAQIQLALEATHVGAWELDPRTGQLVWVLSTCSREFNILMI